MIPYPIFLDANVLYSKILIAVLLDMADNQIISFLWSDQVIQEVAKNWKLAGKNPTSVDKTLNDLKSAFALGEITKADYQKTESLLSATHPGDRHVLAAASAAAAGYLVTFNLKHFDASEASIHGLHLIHPDAFLSMLLNRHPNEVIKSIRGSRSRKTRPQLTEVEFLDRFKAASVGNFANNLSNFIGQF